MITTQELKDYPMYCIMSYVASRGCVVDDLDQFSFMYAYIYHDGVEEFEFFEWNIEDVAQPTFHDIKNSITTEEYMYYKDIHNALIKLSSNMLVYGNTEFQQRLKSYLKCEIVGEYFNTDEKKRYTIFNGEYF